MPDRSVSWLLRLTHICGFALSFSAIAAPCETPQLIGGPGQEPYCTSRDGDMVCGFEDTHRHRDHSRQPRKPIDWDFDSQYLG